jgi:SMC interacting uncharacterized protein involved in chromosome segregation
MNMEEIHNTLEALKSIQNDQLKVCREMLETKTINADEFERIMGKLNEQVVQSINTMQERRDAIMKEIENKRIEANKEIENKQIEANREIAQKWIEIHSRPKTLMQTIDDFSSNFLRGAELLSTQHDNKQ